MLNYWHSAEEEGEQERGESRERIEEETTRKYVLNDFERRDFLWRTERKVILISVIGGKGCLGQVSYNFWSRKKNDSTFIIKFCFWRWWFKVNQKKRLIFLSDLHNILEWQHFNFKINWSRKLFYFLLNIYIIYLVPGPTVRNNCFHHTSVNKGLFDFSITFQDSSLLFGKTRALRDLKRILGPFVLAVNRKITNHVRL